MVTRSASASMRPRSLTDPMGPGHSNVNLDPPWTGMLVLDDVDGRIMYVEVLDRPPLD